MHPNRIHIGGQNALGGIFTDIPNTRSCVTAEVRPDSCGRLVGSVGCNHVKFIKNNKVYENT